VIRIHIKALLLMFVLFPAFMAFPRQASTNPVSRPTQANQQPTGKQKVASPAPVKDATPSEENQNENKTPTREREPRHIVVDGVPKIEKDPWDKVYICLTVALVVIAGLTLRIIWDQATQTRIAAEAARDSAAAASRNTDVLIDIERAWLIPSGGVHPKSLPTRRLRPIQTELLVVQINNFGRTPAWITDSWIDIQVLSNTNIEQ
jgi:hypothetical protein